MSRTRNIVGTALLAVASLFAAIDAEAQIKVGIVVSATGPAASLGIPQKNTAALLPREMSGQKIEYIVLDDASDTTTAVKDIKKLIDEEHVDVVIGPSTTPNAIAMTDPAVESETPVISLAAAAALITPMDARKRWIFKTPQNDSLMAGAVVDHMAAAKIPTIAIIALSDSYGQNWVNEMTRLAGEKGIRIVATESYQPADASVTGQVLRVVAAKPDAILIASRGTPAVLPAKALKERGYKGPIYQTHGVANNDFLRVGGKDVEGSIVPVGPVLVATQLPDSNPSKKLALEYTRVYEQAYGPGSVATFGAHLWDADLLLQAALPAALAKAKPGTKEFRIALRDSLENVRNLTITQGVMNMTAADHSGLDQRSRVMVTVEDGKWKLMP
ncbi:MAG: ABC transporter substrate-binding protein [Burkholderiaceae bacterium]